MKYSNLKMEFCCSELKDAFTELHIEVIYNSKLDHPKDGPGLGITTYNPDHYSMWNYCPYCGNKIEQIDEQG